MTSPRTRGANPGRLLETLEQRTLLTADIQDGTLFLDGDKKDNHIVIEAGPDEGTVIVHGVPKIEDGRVFTHIDRVIIRAKGGDDTVTIGSTFAAQSGAPMRFLIDGGKGDDAITGGAGPDLLVGGNGKDTILGAGGDDLIFGENGKDTLRGGAGNDTIFGGNGKDQIFGESGNDMIFGGNGKDYLDGGSGNDIIIGGKGKDTIIDGKGDKFLIKADPKKFVFDGGEDFVHAHKAKIKSDGTFQLTFWKHWS